MDELERIARECASVEDALLALRKAGASPVPAIKAVRNAWDLSLYEAKVALHDSPAWAPKARAAGALHDEILRILDEEDL